MHFRILFFNFLILLILISCSGGGGGGTDSGVTKEDQKAKDDDETLDNEIYHYEPDPSPTSSVRTFSSEETGEIAIPPLITFFFKSDGTGKRCDNLSLRNELEEMNFTYKIKKDGTILQLFNDEDGSKSTYNINKVFGNKIGLGGFDVNPGVTSLFEKQLLSQDENFETLFSSPCLFSVNKLLDRYTTETQKLNFPEPGSNEDLSFDLILKSLFSGEIDLSEFIEIISKIYENWETGYVPGTGYVPDPGTDYGTGSWSPGNFSQGYACWTWEGSGTPTSNPAAPTVTNSGTWNWYSTSKCWVWTGYGTPPTPSKPSSDGSPGYEYPPGQEDPGYTSDCYAKGVSTGGGGTLPYYRIPVSGHGNPGNLVWSSSALSSTDQKILTTDARFNLRIAAKAAPAMGAKDYKGITCNYEGLAYTKIKLTVGLRRPNSNVYTAYYDLSDIPVGKCSNVLEFSDYQIPVTDGPIVIDIFNFKHDYYCKVYENSQYANNPYYCPYTPMYSNDCFSIEVQFSTDYTLDIPH